MPKNKRFEQRIQNIPSEIWSKISEIDVIKGRWIEGARLSPQALGRLKKSVLSSSTGASTRIEGAKLTDEEVENLMQGIKTQKFAERDAQEARGYYELLKNVFDSFKSIKFGESPIKHLHKELLKYTKKDQHHLGEYKKSENKVVAYDEKGKQVGVIFEPTSPYLVAKEMQELIDWTKNALEEKKINPLIIIGNFLVEFLQIHPFQDGNGRLSRILTNLLLLRHGFSYVQYVSHEKLIEDNKNDYYLALRRSQKTFGTKKEAVAPWLEFFLNILLKQSEMAINLLEKEDIEKLLSLKQIAVWRYLLEKEEAAPSEISEKTKVARPTVNQALDKLMKLKKVERIGEGRSIRYRKT
jgi:Fic family protein